MLNEDEKDYEVMAKMSSSRKVMHHLDNLFFQNFGSSYHSRHSEIEQSIFNNLVVLPITERLPIAEDEFFREDNPCVKSVEDLNIAARKEMKSRMEKVIENSRKNRKESYASVLDFMKVAQVISIDELNELLV